MQGVQQSRPPVFEVQNQGAVATFHLPDADEAEHRILRECLLSNLGTFGEQASTLQPNVRSSGLLTCISYGLVFACHVFKHFHHHH